MHRIVSFSIGLAWANRKLSLLPNQVVESSSDDSVRPVRHEPYPLAYFNYKPGM